MDTTVETSVIVHGSEAYIPLNRLKKSPRNARKTPHSQAVIEAFAASIHAKGMLQSPVVEPEYREDGSPTGNYLVTIGEGRRLAQLLRAKRKQIKKTEPIRCVVDLENDAHEISLDENVTREAMHPADQFEAFQRLAEERGFGAEEIAARFGVTAAVVRQRLKLASVSARLMSLYRAGDMTLEQVMAFTLTDDHARQEAVWESLPEWDRHPQSIRRHLTRDRVRASDRRAVFVGAEAYQGAGGVIERDLFTEDGGGYFTDPSLLDRLALERLGQIADTKCAKGWKWAEASVDCPTNHGFSRLRPQIRDVTAEEAERHDTLAAEAASIEAAEWSEAGERRHAEIIAEQEAMEAARLFFAPEDMARSGVFIFIDHEGRARCEYGFVRPEDDVPWEETTEAADDAGPVTQDAPDEPAPPRPSPLSDKLIAELTAHKTAAVRDALAQQSGIAFTALLHVLVCRTFGDHRSFGCLDVRLGGANLPAYAPDIEDSPAGRAVSARHDAWAAKLGDAEDVWTFLAALSHDDGLALLAHCVSLTVSGVQTRDRGVYGHDPIDDLAEALALDMNRYWTPTSAGYFSRVSKARTLDAVREAVSEDAASALQGAKKAVMAEAAEQLITGTGWLPEPLRTRTADAETERPASA